MTLEPPDDIQDWTDEEKYPQICECPCHEEELGQGTIIRNNCCDCRKAERQKA